MRRIVWFSCGAASAVTAKVALEAHPDALVVNCDTTVNEHPDNKRFRSDVSDWLGRGIIVIHSEKYKGGTVEEVFEDRKYMSGPAGACCTTELKKVPRFAFQQPDDIHIFGFTCDEYKRMRDFSKRNPELNLEWPMFDAGITKRECLERLEGAGIKLPALYAMGYRNNNCLGCVKATSPKYWNKVRQDFPAVFASRAEQSRRIGCRLVRLHGERIFLDELPADKTEGEEESISCGPECGQVS